MDVCSLLLSTGIAVNHKNKKGETALWIAVTQSDIQMVKLLIAYKASMTVMIGVNGRRRTVLHEALRLQRLDIVWTLRRR